jgi:hypothetical protein
MSKRKRKSAQQAPRQKDHSPEQVKEIALMLYAQRPFPLNTIKSKSDLESLVWQANDFLDVADELNEGFCDVVARRRKAAIKAAKETADTIKALPEIVPFDKAVKVITRQQRLERALERFEALRFIDHETAVWVARLTPNFGGAIPKPQTKLWREKIAHWRKNGMKRDEVIWRRVLYDENVYRRWRIATAERAKKRRAPWSDKKRIKVALESSARQRKVDALLDLARGKIE